MFAVLAELQGTAGLADDQYLGFVGIPKPPVREIMLVVYLQFSPSCSRLNSPFSSAWLSAAPWSKPVHVAEYL
jgi:hypothetical protein